VEQLECHLSVMRLVLRNGPIGIMRLTEELGQPHYRIRYSLRVLEQLQYVRTTPAGAIATSKAYDMFENFDVNLGDLIGRLATLRQDKPISKS
jgi:predicted transcriptional regulator